MMDARKEQDTSSTSSQVLVEMSRKRLRIGAWIGGRSRAPVLVLFVVVVVVAVYLVARQLGVHFSLPITFKTEEVGLVAINGVESGNSVQNMTNSPGGQQAVLIDNRVTTNVVRAFLTTVCVKKGGGDGDRVMWLTFKQRDGIWDAGLKSQFNIKLSGPYLTSQFKSGYTGSTFGGNIGTRLAREEGLVLYQYSSAPGPGDVVLEIRSKALIDAVSIEMRPRLKGTVTTSTCE